MPLVRDIIYYHNYTPAADICTLVLCMFFLCLLHFTYTERTRTLRLFQWSNLLLLLASLANMVFCQLTKSITPVRVPWIYISRDVAYLSMIATMVLYCIYIKYLVGLGGWKGKALSAFVWGNYVLFSALVLAGPFTKFGFFIDENLRIHQNYIWDIFHFAYVYYLLVVAILLYRLRKKFITNVYRCLLCVVFIALALMVVQSFFMQHSFTCYTMVLPLLAVLFLFHYNSYDIVTGTLDAKSFDAYTKELRDEDFSLIFLYLQNMNTYKMKNLSEEFFHFNETFFKNPCTFRLKDDKLVLVYKKKENPNGNEQSPRILAEFRKLYDMYQVDFRLMFMDSDNRLSCGYDYLALNEFMEKKMNINTSYQCSEADVTSFLKSRYILKELQNIYLKHDLNDTRIKVYCQPVLNTETNVFSSAEALMRLELPDYGIIYPDQFIPFAEEYNYIHVLSLIILNKTCAQVKQLEANGYQIERVSVNFAIQELQLPNFCDDVISIIAHHGLPFEKIALELTESQNERDFINVQNIMARLHSFGLKFYLDDFGTGYSNFERIIGLPIDIIKFDRSLTILAGKNSESRFLVSSFSDIFKKSNYQILFEGVENEQDENQCKEMNAMYLQGYKYSRPIPIENLSSFLCKKAAV